uniref:SARNP n=1 Tax=Pan troglodytes TaxID=9598 RepID=A0A2I3S653_PANTR
EKKKQSPIEIPVKEEELPEKTVDVEAEKKVVKITSEIPQGERMQKRAEKVHVPKTARAARFGTSSVSTKGLNLDKLKERAQRFGLNGSSISRKSEDDEKLKRRNTEDTEAKNRKRAARYGIAC